MAQITISKRALPCAVEKLHELAAVDFSDIPHDPFSMPRPKLSRDEAVDIADRLLNGESVGVEKSKPLSLEAETFGSKVRIDLTRYAEIHGDEALKKALSKIQEC